MKKLSDLNDDTMLITQYWEDSDWLVDLESKRDMKTKTRQPVRVWIASGDWIHFCIKSVYSFFDGIEDRNESCFYDAGHWRKISLPSNWRNLMFESVKNLPETQAFIDALNRASQQIGSCFKGEEVDLDEEAK